MAEIQNAFRKIGLGTSHLFDIHGEPTALCQRLIEYFQHRADTLNQSVEKMLMDEDDARDAYESLLRDMKAADFQSRRLPPMNKQTGSKKAVAYFTAIINLLIEHTLAAEGDTNLGVDFDPRVLTTATLNSAPLRTLARRVDGAFPSTVNPIAIWEIKEYYYTTTFGSRVADGVYESLLDGLEIEELRDQEGIDIKHYVMVDSHFTWWICGKSYLCRFVDMIHMGYADEVLFGREVIDILPRLVQEWVVQEKSRTSTEPQPQQSSTLF